MGDRASYAIRENGEVAVFFGQFGANTLLADIFWSPDTCEEMIRRQERDEWLDDVFGEAAVALCKDTRSVAFYDCRYDADTRQLAARMMRQLWPGWTVRAVRYVSGVAATLGIDLAMLEKVIPGDGFEQTILAAQCVRRTGRAGILEFVRDGHRDRRVVQTSLPQLLSVGPRLIEAIPFMTSLDDALVGLATTSDPTGEAVPLFEDYGSPGVATIDVDARTLDVTYAVNPSTVRALALTDAAAPLWPGWTVRRQAGRADEHFARLGAPTDAYLEAIVVARPDVECVRSLAQGLFASEAHKEGARAWLDRVVGSSESLTTHPWPVDRRLAQFKTALRQLAIDIDLDDALERARTASTSDFHHRDNDDLERGAWGYLPDVVRGNGFALALAKGIVDGKRRTPTLLRWDDPSRPPRAVCELADDRFFNTSSLSLSPSGRACIAMVSTYDEHELYWIDLTSERATRIAQSSEYARLNRATFAWAPDRDRMAFSFQDERAHDGIGETVVAVYDGLEGYVGEHAGAVLLEWTDELRVRRGSTHQDFTPTAGPALVGARLLDTASGIRSPDSGVRARAMKVEASRRACAAHERQSTDRRARDAERDPVHAVQLATSALELDEANELAFATLYAALAELDELDARLRLWAARHISVRPASPVGWRALCELHLACAESAAALDAAERAIALAPFDPDGSLLHGIALVQVGRLDDAIAACHRSLACRPNHVSNIALAPGFEPLWGHPRWVEFDYVRLLHAASGAGDADLAVARYCEAVALAPTRNDAYRALLELADLEPTMHLEVTDRWRTSCPEERDAWIAHAKERAEHGDAADARASIAALIARWPDEYRGHVYSARLAIDSEGDAVALQHLKRAQQIAMAVGEQAEYEMRGMLEDDNIFEHLLAELYDYEDDA